VKHPAFNAASVSSSTLNVTTNNTEITLISPEGNIQVVNLSPEARKNLLMSLLARPQHPNALNALPANGFRYVVLDKATPGLEVSFGNNLAIPITFPKEAISVLKQQIAALEQSLAQSKSQKH
jgi:hypothetical protein